MRDEIRDKMLALKRDIVESHKPCKGSGWLEPISPGVPNPCECMTVFHYLNCLIESGIPRDYWWLTIDELEIDEDYKALCHWYTKRLQQAFEHGLGMMFLGPNGIGKTSMQCALGKEAIVKGYTVKYFTAQQYIEATKNTEDVSLLKEYEDGDFILLDEMDKVYIKSRSNYVTKTLEDFLRRKTSEGSAIIICTNHDQQTLIEVFGQSTVSMLQRHLKIVGMEGDDYSEKLQSRWDDLMESSRDYFDKAILVPARQLMERELKEDERDWKEASK
jgi:IstB-like ATP binding protein